jgi:hypothetical protein
MVLVLRDLVDLHRHQEDPQEGPSRAEIGEKLGYEFTSLKRSSG